jgi:ABC-2 type transport system ATP-binding protein
VVVGRGRVIADANVSELLAGAAAGRITLRTDSVAVAEVLSGEGGVVTRTGPDTWSVSGLEPQRVVALLGAAGVPFSEIAAHRPSLEEAYLELTRNAVDYRAPGGAR